MKIYESKYRYSKLDHTKIKRMIYEISEGLKNHEILCITDFFESNKLLEMNLERSKYIKNLIYMDLLCSIQKSSINICYGLFRVKKFKIKLNWYYKNDLWRLWEYTFRFYNS